MSVKTLFCFSIILFASEMVHAQQGKPALAEKNGSVKKPSVQKAQPQFDPVATGLRSVPIVPAAVRTIAVNKDGSLLAIGTGQGEIAIWNTKLNKFIHRWKAHDEWVFDLAFDPTSKQLISGGGDNYTKVWSVDGWKRIHAFRDHKDDVHGVVMTPDGKVLVTGGDDTNVIVRQMETDQTTTLKGHTAQVTSIILSPDGKRVYSSSRDQTIRVWDIAEMKEVAVLSGHREDILHLAIDRSGQYLASASYDGTVRVWSLKTLKTEQVLQVPDVWMLAVEFSADASLVFTGSTDFHLRAFDRESQRELWKSYMATDVSDLVLTPNGKQLIASYAASGVSIFDFTNEKAIVIRKIRVNANAVPRVVPLTTTEYLQMHNALLFEQDKPDWGKKVGLLALHGDQFTDHLLRNIDISKLPAPKQELATRLRNKLREMYKPFDGIPFTKRILAKFWGDLAVAEYLDLPVSAQLQAWLTQETSKAITQPEQIPFILKQLENEIAKSLNALEKPEIDKQKLRSAKKKVLIELTKALE